ncbi:MAG: DUF4065 domain-containing protein [Cytophagales bacterium]|nr:MAG: DUF4065 domain-containing protein [Cytophagales bacterium]
MFRDLQNEKIGNLLIYLASKIKDLGITKTLKLFYLIDETSVKEVGTPVTWLEYKVWEMGPVAVDIYNEVQHLKHSTLSSFISVERKKSFDYETTIIKPLKSFDDSEFNDYEVELIDRIIEKYGNMPAKNLIDILHKEDTLWHKNVIKNELKFAFSLYNRRSNVVIELADLIADNDMKLIAYKSAVNALEFQTQLAND